MAKHRTRVGLHARNAILFPEQDYELMRLARIEALKMLSLTDVSVYERLRREQPDMEFIVRLYDDRIRRDSRPSPAQFVTRMTPIIGRLKPYVTKFEIHNEPNHASGIEGWGPSDENAQSFRVWYLHVLSALRQAYPWARFGFPGLALNQPHRDLAWLEICKDAIQASDWLGCHCYWQYGNMFSDQWGLRFTLYHQRFPTKEIEITEFGNSTPNLPREEMARQYVQYYQELNKYPYLGSANSFIASSPDPAWVHFVWMKEGGEMLPVVHSVGNMERKPVEISPLPPPPSPPEPKPLPTPELVEAEVWALRSKIAEMEASIRELGRRLFATGPAQPPMEDIVEGLLTHPTRRYASRSLADIQQIVIHHTATNPSITPQRLAQYQVQQQGRAGIIYHFCVAADGTIYWTNRLETVSDHAYSQNQRSVGICFPGNFTTTIPTDAQLEAGGRLCTWLLGSLRLLSSAIVGLGEFVNTQSPGKQWLSGQRWKEKLTEIVEATMEASAEGQAAIIASLREQITALKDEIETLKQQLAAASLSFGPEPEAAKIRQPVIQDLIDKLPKHSTNTYNSRALSNIRHLVIHHSAVPPSVGPQRIAAYHVNKQDWPGIGYHFLVAEDGSIYQGNALETVSYHAVTANPQGVGICFLGNFAETVPPPDQLEAGAHLIAWLMQGLGIALDQVKGHKEFMDTACPGEQWLKGEKWKETLRKEITKVQEAATQPSPAPTADGKALHHYVLFWARDAEWAKNDWLNAQNYIGAFRPTAGFSTDEAAQAEYVTIVGGPLGVSSTVEEQLKAAGCKVDRVAGKDVADTKRKLDDLVKQGKRFENLKE